MYEEPNLEGQNLGCNGWARYNFFDTHVACGV
jgi:hypothetical protein